MPKSEYLSWSSLLFHLLCFVRHCPQFPIHFSFVVLQGVHYLLSLHYCAFCVSLDLVNMKILTRSHFFAVTCLGESTWNRG